MLLTRFLKFNRQNLYFSIAVLSLLLISFIALPFGTGDTAELVISSQKFGECLSSGAFFGCNDLERFGLSPHVLSVIIYSIFNDVNSTITGWAILNFSLYLYFLWDVQKRFSNHNFIILGVLIFSPLTAYAIYSYTEMSFIVFTYFLLIAIKNKKLLLVIGLGILVSAYRESSIILTIPLSLAIIFSNQTIRLSQFAINIAPQLLGFFLYNLFNFYKYNNFVNVEYQLGRVTESKMIISNFFGIWFSPSGGILGYFWLSIIFLTFINLNYLRIKKKNLAFYSILGALILNLLLLSNWFAPFGWVTWGPRLFMPTVVLSLMAILIAENNFQDIKSNLLRIVYAISTALSSLSLLGFLVNSDVFRQWLTEVIFKTKACPELYIWETQPDLYSQCFIEMSWNLNSLPVLSIKNLLNFMVNNFQSNGLQVLLSFIFILSLIGYLKRFLFNNVK